MTTATAPQTGEATRALLPCLNCGAPATGRVAVHVGGHTGHDTRGMCGPEEGCTIAYRGWLISQGRVPLLQTVVAP